MSQTTATDCTGMTRKPETPKFGYLSPLLKPSTSNTALVFTCTDSGIKHRLGWSVMAVFANMDVGVKCGAGTPRRFFTDKRPSKKNRSLTAIKTLG
jgi:hypothetical protein